ncbi:MAG: hypothetical protein HY657_18145 [Acidobacteria bacterium]|nr:hypothetical protein [Acidobacteriota bacterium]
MTQTRRHSLATAGMGLAALWLAGSPLAWHGSGGPTGSGAADMGPAPFSNPLTSLLPPPGYRTCMLGNFAGLDPDFVPSHPGERNPGHAQEHHWTFLSRTGGPVTLIVTAASVSPSDVGGLITATASHEPTGSTSSVAVAHSGIGGPTGDVSAVLTVPTLANVPYDLTIAAASIAGAPQGGHHYKVGVLGPAANTVEIGYGSPTLEYHESGLNRWAINAQSGETGAAHLSVDDPALAAGGVPNQATIVTYSLLDPVAGPPPLLGPTTSPVGPGSPIVVPFANGSGGPRTYIVSANADGHYTLTRTAASDEGIYVLNCPGDRGTVAIDIKPGSFPNSINLRKNGTVAVAIFSRPGFDATTVDPETVTLAGAPVAQKRNGTLMAGTEDVDGDGRDDLVVHFDTGALNLVSGDTVAVLEGRTFSGLPVLGADSVRLLP